MCMIIPDTGMVISYKGMFITDMDIIIRVMGMKTPYIGMLV